MTGGSGAIHSPDWTISDPAAGYLAPAKTMAMMAIDLLYDNANTARGIIENNKPKMTKGQYLDEQKALFNRELFEGLPKE